MKTIKGTLFLVMLALVMNSCKKDEDTNTPSSVSIRMTDAPGPYNAVYIDLRGVEITGNNGKAVMLNVNQGIYNLLDFANGADTLIAMGSIYATSVQQIRLILGPNNTVMEDNISYPLSTPSADQSGLKLQVHQTLQPGVHAQILLDFDANQSVVKTGSGTFKLKPVIKTIVKPISGSIRGKITPAGTLAYASATSNMSSYSSGVDGAGNFLLMGIPEGVYSVTVTPASPFNPVTRNNITVTKGVVADLGTINF